MEENTRIDSSLVQEFVGKAHGDLDRVRQMLAEQPALLNAAWDWGGGDWETALGAAAHMGRRDIAEMLLAKGARIDIFAAAMLGQVNTVRAIVQSCAASATSPGPHGIPLIRHAIAGGEAAAGVVAYLQSLQSELPF